MPKKAKANVAAMDYGEDHDENQRVAAWHARVSS
jgi:hypothetical protein